MDNLVEEARGDTTRLNYHDFDYPWISGATPHAEKIELATRQWVIERGLLHPDDVPKRYDPLNIGLLTALTYPEAPIDRLLIVASFLTWIFIQDDHYDNIVISLDPSRLLQKVKIYINIVNGTGVSPDANRVFIALAEIIDQISKLAPSFWMHRFARSMSDFWMKGIIKETEFRMQGIVPDPLSYMDMRLYSVGVRPVLDLVEFSQGSVLPDHVIEHPDLERLWHLTAKIIIYTNDVLSYQKERRVGDPNNLVHVLMQHNRLNFTDAVDHAVRLHDEALHQFLKLASSLPDWGPEVAPVMKKYLAGHRAWIRGALDWQIISRRYATGRDYLESAR